MTLVAHRHDVTRQQIYRWRHELKKKGLWSAGQGAIFLPLDMPPFGLPHCAVAPVPSLPVELRLAQGRCLQFDSVMDEATLTRLIRAVDAA